ncbi:spore coat biosynthesis protein F [Candidatus Falkowbacteria bacterium CG10_big_fil_rev_8_21_14_0_10_43_11]|uniref:Spore coat biosynthesis protein F n=1 Tax=Candidatus Falkowbacteria bacterium CG10_big_fil_rev_8_21_14_0_10_43_11 TaxID=1974568 RepID=A0A2M6WLC0_9BACT|nr:MAG: spore coat biosynthesis protein F [Candidatus Falkowbacteria bacterium CG10_big_fil_rev_8_21_14_0_10_43_11]
MKNNKKVVATIEARMNATRLPGKVLMPLTGESILIRIIERLSRSKYIDDIIVATTINPKDDAIEKVCRADGYKFYRGSEENVLSRILEAAEICQAEIIVQGMADSPMVDWRIVDYLINTLADGGYDYASNELEEGFPIGFDVRVFPYLVLKQVKKLATDPEHHEHASLYIYQHPERYKLFSWRGKGKMNWPELRLTLDTPEDYELISKVYNALMPAKPDFSAEDVVDYLRNKPQLYNINQHVKQKVPYKK